MRFTKEERALWQLAIEHVSSYPHIWTQREDFLRTWWFMLENVRRES